MNRSLLARLQADGRTYQVRYVHNGGDISCTGLYLVSYFATPALVDELFALGDLGYLDDSLETVYAYHRDNGEPLVLNTASNLAQAGRDHDACFVYLWGQEGWQAFAMQRGQLEAVALPAPLRLFVVDNVTGQHFAEVEAPTHEEAAALYRTRFTIQGYAKLATTDAALFLSRATLNVKQYHETYDKPLLGHQAA